MLKTDAKKLATCFHNFLLFQPFLLVSFGSVFCRCCSC